LVAIGAALLALYFVFPETNGSIVSKTSFWGGIISVSLGMVWLITTYLEKTDNQVRIMSTDNASTKLSEQGLVVYKLLHDRISELKKQQWTITNYVVLLYAAIFAAVRELTLSGWQRCLLSGALLVAGGYGIACLAKVQCDLGETKKRLDHADAEIFSTDGK
jgi:hypothetical protein